MPRGNRRCTVGARLAHVRRRTVRTHALLPLAAAEYMDGLSASELGGGLLLMGTLATSSFGSQGHGGQYALSPRELSRPRNNLAAHLSRVVYEGSRTWG